MAEKGQDTLTLADFGSQLGTRALGRKVRQYAEGCIGKQNRLVFTFQGIHHLGSAFADELFGQLFVDLGEERYRDSISVEGFDSGHSKSLMMLIIEKTIEIRKNGKR